MLQATKSMRARLFGVVIGCIVVIGGVCGVCAQTASTTKPTATKGSKDSGRDPFKRYEAPRVVVKKTGLLLPPSIQDRIAQYKAQKAAAMNARLAAPKPTTALLLAEIQVVGITRTPRGYAAIVEATPIRLSYVIYPGEKFYDGQLVAIEDNRLIFRREMVFADGRRERSVELKALRPATSVNAMTGENTAVMDGAPTENEKRPEQKLANSEKP